MPSDVRRNAAPEKRENYRNFVERDHETNGRILCGEKELRSDGRTRDQHRKICKFPQLYILALV